MSFDDDFNNNPSDPSLNDPFRHQHSSEGMGTGTKILLGILGFFALCGCVCCGGLYYMYLQIDPSFTATNDPAEIEELRKTFVEIDIPAEYSPVNGFSGGAFGTSGSVVNYKGPTEFDHLVLSSGKGKVFQDENFKFNMNDGANNTPIDENTELDTIESETRELTVNGQQVEFQFVRARIKKRDPFNPPMEDEPAPTEDENDPTKSATDTDKPSADTPPDPPVDATEKGEPQKGKENTEGDHADHDAHDHTGEHTDGAEESGEIVYRVTGWIATPNGGLSLMMMVSEENWDEAKIIQMIESIVPVNDAE